MSFTGNEKLLHLTEPQRMHIMINDQINSKLVIIVLAFLVLFCERKIPENPKPNLLFVFPDQFQAQSLAYKGENPVKTPNLDKFSEEGIVFTNAVSNRPLCSPYRAMLMTGKYPFSTGVLTNVNTSSRKYRNYLDPSETTFADILSYAGYHTGYIGKWHLDAPKGPDVDRWQDSKWDAYTPPGRHSFDFWHAYGTYDEHLTPRYWINDAPRQDTTFVNEWSPIHEVDVAIDFIGRNKDTPWALFLAMNPPHPPYHLVPDKYHDIYADVSVDDLVRPNVPDGSAGNQGRSNVQSYYGMISGVDEQIGRLLRKLEEEGEADNTIVVFTSDHGELMGSHGLMQKVAWYEESLNIPFMVRWPHHIEPRIDSLNLSVPDVMPTIISLMGLSGELPADLEGHDYSSIILGDEAPGITRPEYSLYFNPDINNSLGGLRGLRNSKYTFVVRRNRQGETVDYILHDNVNDPFQMENIADQNPDLVKNLETVLLDKLAQIGDPWIVFDLEYDIYY